MTRSSQRRNAKIFYSALLAAVLSLSALAAWGFVGASKAAARKDTGATVTYIARTDAYVQKE